MNDNYVYDCIVEKGYGFSSLFFYTVKFP